MTEPSKKLAILKKVQEGKLIPEEALYLLENDGDVPVQEESPAARWFIVRIADLDTGKERISIRLPIDLVSVGAKLGARYVPDDARFDLNHVLEQARAGHLGRVYEMTDDTEREYIEVFVE